MKSAEDRPRCDAAYVLDGAMAGSVFAKRPMSPQLIIISGIPRQDPHGPLYCVAQTLLATAATMRARQQMKPPEVPADNAKVIEHDDLEPAWAEMRKQLAAA